MRSPRDEPAPIRGAVGAGTFDRSQRAAVSSAVLLALAIVSWPDLYLFSKIFHPPGWSRNFPSPSLAAASLSFGCLLPSVIGSAGRPRVLWIPVLVAPLAGVVIFAVRFSALTGTSLTDAILNTLAQYVWIVVVRLVPPGALAALASVAIGVLSNDPRARRRRRLGP